jgi:Ca2+-transporting ATPase
MGDGTAVAKEASDITIIDNSFSSIGRAVMWGRSLYQNIQRFILFQMTVNVVACLVVLVGAFLGTESPLTVTQMLWVNLIMDTFAAMALASLPPTHKVMSQKPRRREDFIINDSMWQCILSVGIVFFGILLSLLVAFKYADVRCLTDLINLKKGGSGLTEYELSLFFTIFVMLQFWNLFNAKGFASGKSSFILSGCKGFVLIASVILVGQVLIVNIGQEFFNVVPISLKDWAIIIGSTSLVALAGEVIRFQKAKPS